MSLQAEEEETIEALKKWWDENGTIINFDNWSELLLHKATEF